MALNKPVNEHLFAYRINLRAVAASNASSHTLSAWSSEVDDDCDRPQLTRDDTPTKITARRSKPGHTHSHVAQHSTECREPFRLLQHLRIESVSFILIESTGRCQAQKLQIHHASPALSRLLFLAIATIGGAFWSLLLLMTHICARFRSRRRRYINRVYHRLDTHIFLPVLWLSINCHLCQCSTLCWVSQRPVDYNIGDEDRDAFFYISSLFTFTRRTLAAGIWLV